MDQIRFVVSYIFSCFAKKNDSSVVRFVHDSIIPMHMYKYLDSCLSYDNSKMSRASFSFGRTQELPLSSMDVSRAFLTVSHMPALAGS